MQVFVSSLITGMEPLRGAAAEALRTLGHTPVLAESFGASPATPQATCLAGVRQADAVLLILSGRYGALQASGLSATHEEFNEARERRPVFAFVQTGVDREPQQDAFVTEVRDWQGGAYTESFSSPEELEAAVISALHKWELQQARGGPDPEEMLTRALGLLPKNPRGMSTGTTSLALAVAGGPRQAVLRPSELEDPALARELHQAALFGPAPIFSEKAGVERSLERHTLELRQDRPTHSVSLDEDGSIILRLPLSEARGGLPVLIEEEVRETLTNGLRYAAGVLARIDPLERVSHVVPVATLLEGGWRGWRTRAEHAASPDRGSMGLGSDEPAPVSLSPPHRPRAALRQQPDRLAEDLTVLLRRSHR